MNSATFFSRLLLVLALFWSYTARAQEIPEEARRHMLRGQAAVEIAKSAADYLPAIQEFEAAARLAPDWADLHFNLGLVRAKYGDIEGAIESYKRYLARGPDDANAARVRDEIVKLEYMLERVTARKRLAGVWVDKSGTRYTTSIQGDRWSMRADGIAFGRNGTNEMVTVNTSLGFLGENEFSTESRGAIEFLGVVTGDRFVGERRRQAVTEAKSSCDVPESRVRVEGGLNADAELLTLEFELEKQAVRFNNPLPLIYFCEGATVVRKERQTLILRKAPN